MSSIVKVRNMRLGDGIPKICIPITDVDLEGIKKSICTIKDTPYDFIEWRADFYKGVGEPESLIRAMTLLHDEFGNTPVLFTLRTNLEMGEIEIDTDDYLAINRAVIESGLVDMIDVELSRGDTIMKTLVESAHRADIRVIGSRHDMTATPDKDTIVGSLCKMQDLGADVAKFAVMPQSERDVLTLLDATLTMREKHNDTPVITMSMGRMGAVSRICGGTFGSSVTFGTAGKASAPGQLPANLLSVFLKSLS